MKVCPICGAPVRCDIKATAHQEYNADGDGYWVVDDADSLDELCEAPYNHAYCTNELCGDVLIFADDTKLTHVATVQRESIVSPVKLVYSNPSISPLVFSDVDSALKAYFYSSVKSIPNGSPIPKSDRAYDSWYSTCIEYEPWVGRMLEAPDV